MPMGIRPDNLARVLDLYSRQFTGWAMSEHIDTELTLGPEVRHA
jgi:hypothetical protein